MNRRNVISGIAAAGAAAVLLASPVVTAAAESAAIPRTHTVEIRDTRFTPQHVRARPGDTIVWVNHDIVPHTATARDESWDTGTIEAGENGSIILTGEMAGDYFCVFHPSMVARIDIQEH